jgi:hypothetical protein
MSIDNNDNYNNKIIKKKSHSALDEAMFSSLNGLVFGLTFNLSLFHKSLPYHSLPLKSKFGMVFRNTSTIVFCIFLNKYVEESFNKKENKILLKNFYLNDKSIFILKNVLSTIIPFFFGFKYYYFKNKNPCLDKSTFILFASVIFAADMSKK